MAHSTARLTPEASDTAVIAAIIDQESERFTNDPLDRGGPTKFGITARTLGRARRLGRLATAEEVEALEKPEAVDIYRRMYIIDPGFTTEVFPYEPLRRAVIDAGVNFGAKAAIKHLQLALGVTADGIIGPQTRQAIAHGNPHRILLDTVRHRSRHYGRIVQNDHTQVRFIVGWLDRAFDQLDPLVEP
jgi:lysozyme family protein